MATNLRYKYIYLVFQWTFTSAKWRCQDLPLTLPKILHMPGPLALLPPDLEPMDLLVRFVDFLFKNLVGLISFFTCFYLDGNSFKMWKIMTFVICLPGIALSTFVNLGPNAEHHHRPEFVPYEYMRIRSKVKLLFWNIFSLREDVSSYRDFFFYVVRRRYLE